MSISSERALQFFRMMTNGAEPLGNGVGRTVYPIGDDMVVKVEDVSKSFQNITEWQFWEQMQYTELAGWLAPCINISPDGSVLLQKRASRLAKLPKRVPYIFADIKLENWGRIGRKIVCVDYGHHLALGMVNIKKMRDVR